MYQITKRHSAGGAGFSSRVAAVYNVERNGKIVGRIDMISDRDFNDRTTCWVACFDGHTIKRQAFADVKAAVMNIS